MPVSIAQLPIGRGPLLVIGGAEDPDIERAVVLPRFVELAGGADSHVLVCAGATTHADETNRAYAKAFGALGAGAVETLPFDSRDEADSAEALAALERATAVFLTGGDQLRLTHIVSGTAFGQRLAERSAAGMPIGGTSAGAAALSGTMIAHGDGNTVCRACVHLSPGLALWPGALVDTHFDRSGRVHRVMSALAQNPGVLGVGLDEDTAVEVRPEGELRVYGRGVAFVFDARGARSNVADERATTPISLTGLSVHVLAHGFGYDLTERRPLDPVPPDEPAPNAHEDDDRDGPDTGDSAETPAADAPGA